MQGKLTRAKLIQIVIVLAILMAAFTYRTLWQASDAGISPSTDIQICDLSHAACRLIQGDKVLTATASPRPIKAESPFVIRLDGLGKAPAKAWVEGRDMFMGRIPLEPRQEAGVWVVDAMVGACTEPAMVWQLVVETEGETPLKIPFTVTR